MNKPYIIRRIKYRLNIYGKSGKNEKSKTLRRIIAFILLFTCITFFAIYKIEKRLFLLAQNIGFSQVENTISRECNLCIEDIIKKNGIDMSAILSSATNGAPTSISADYSEVNLLKTQVADRITQYINDLASVTCNIPSGALISDNVFSGYGFNIPVRMIVTGTAYVDFVDDFISAGINQTKYRLALRVTVVTELHTVFDFKQANFTTDIPIAEKVIVGDVPSFMVNK